MQNSEILLCFISAKLPFSLSCDKTLDSFQKLKVYHFISIVSITQLRMSAFSRKINKTFCLSYFTLVPLSFFIVLLQKSIKYIREQTHRTALMWLQSHFSRVLGIFIFGPKKAIAFAQWPFLPLSKMLLWFKYQVFFRAVFCIEQVKCASRVVFHLFQVFLFSAPKLLFCKGYSLWMVAICATSKILLRFEYLTVILRGRAGYELIYITNEAVGRVGYYQLISGKSET